MQKFVMIIYRGNEDQEFIGDVPELPRCMTHGDHLETVLWKVKEAIHSCIEQAHELGLSVPPPEGGLFILD